jgi:hypothetical protein
MDIWERRIEAGVSLRVVRSHVGDLHQLWPESAADRRTLRYAPVDFVFAMTTYIFDKKVAVISSRQENFAITIESEEFARMQTGVEILGGACRPLRMSGCAGARQNLVTGGWCSKTASN